MNIRVYCALYKYPYFKILRIPHALLYVIQQNVVIYKAYHHKCEIYENIYTRNIIPFRKPL